LSHGAVLWLYALFLSQHKKDYSRAIRYLEEAVEIFAKNKHKNYYSVLAVLAEDYYQMYTRTNDNAYKIKFINIYEKLPNNKTLADLMKRIK
jgi:tetratricopeptide (TPR) repeat protein